MSASRPGSYTCRQAVQSMRGDMPSLSLQAVSQQAAMLGLPWMRVTWRTWKTPGMECGRKRKSVRLPSRTNGAGEEQAASSSGSSASTCERPQDGQDLRQALRSSRPLHTAFLHRCRASESCCAERMLAKL